MTELLHGICLGNESFLPDALLQVHSWWSLVFQLTDVLSVSKLNWQRHFDIGSSCLALCGSKMIWVGWADSIQQSKIRVVTMKRALKELSKHLVRFHAPWLMDSWKWYHLQLFDKLRETLDTFAGSGLDLADHWYDIPMNDVLNHFRGIPMQTTAVSSVGHAAVPGAPGHAAAAEASGAEAEGSVVQVSALSSLQVHAPESNALGSHSGFPLSKRQRVRGFPRQCTCWCLTPGSISHTSRCKRSRIVTFKLKWFL
jgi:hypothetical protein